MDDSNSGVIGKILSWGTSASFSDSTVSAWLGGLAVVLVLAFLWTTVLRLIPEGEL